MADLDWSRQERPKPKGIESALNHGAWVTGRNHTGLLMSTMHKGHVIMVIGIPRKAEHSNAGYKQDARCLHCNEEFANVDGEFLQERVDDQYILREIDSVKGQGQHLRRYYARLVKEVTGT